ncbi:MAG: GDSL-like Lipase/Acylhydrolase, partial [Planctomycetaceae bacterium]|nr:GDSL-like Lipase/Acylhydrolase [Planctomycetaceae bacterium]
ALYNKLADAGATVGRFRFVLWQQGESDVIESVNTETYAKNLTKIHDELAKRWGFEPKWLLAKSTLHPTVYNFPEREQAIRTAIDQLWKQRGFGPGPDTDILDGENRGGPKTRRHFSGIGQRRAALMWLTAIWPALNSDLAPVIHPAKAAP